ncbi:hypothetical protein GWK47_033608 [Chionoecetes opilio]|uniref:Uncharacterized protein n=1 Tax=Chionoecetes opilio TaxID=41210 RepID=A0A8J4YWI0_CHIOP|nr:hypothetical protein GWK47_033608 [Chionoecetes opilio]
MSTEKPRVKRALMPMQDVSPPSANAENESITYLGGRGLLRSSNWKETGEFLSLVDEWFDVMNSSVEISYMNARNGFGILHEYQVKQIVTYFRRSISSSDALRAGGSVRKACAGATGADPGRGRPRWNSTFYSFAALCRVGRMREPGLALEGPSDALPMLTSEELAFRQLLGAVRGPFDKATKEISGEKYGAHQHRKHPAVGLTRDEFGGEQIEHSAETTAKDVSSRPSKDVPFGT